MLLQYKRSKQTKILKKLKFLINFLKSIGLTFTDRNSAKNAVRYLNTVSYENILAKK